eukprot:Colp12_sorted_trinity150504_noHs@22492
MALINTLMHAVEDNNVNLVNALLSTGEVDVNARGEDGFTPLMNAAFHGHADTCAALLEHKADISITCTCDDEFWVDFESVRQTDTMILDGCTAVDIAMKCKASYIDNRKKPWHRFAADYDAVIDVFTRYLLKHHNKKKEEEVEDLQSEEAQDIKSNTTNSLIEHMATLLERGTHSDVTFYVDGEPFKCHKAILSVRSPVFEAMFGNQMLENIGNVVRLDYIRADVFRAFLAFIYCGSKPEATDGLALDLLQVADMYQVDELKQRCEEVVRPSMTVTNCTHILIAASQFRADNLERNCIQFIVQNFHQVNEREEFRTMSAEHPTLLAAVHRALAERLVSTQKPSQSMV